LIRTALAENRDMTAIGLVLVSSIFMRIAWYWHLKNPTRRTSPIWLVILASWGIAFFEFYVRRVETLE